MLTLFVIAAVLGGTFVALSAFGVGAEHDADLGADTALDGAGDAGDALHADVWTPFLSMRFWTYAITFFGLTGLLLSWLSPLGPLATGLLSGAMGLLTGTGMSFATRALRRGIVDSSATIDDLVGQVATVLVTVKPGDVGEVRVRVKGRDVDLVARTEEGDALAPGDEALVIGFEGTTARVVRASYSEAEGAAAEPAEARSRRG